MLTTLIRIQHVLVALVIMVLVTITCKATKDFYNTDLDLYKINWKGPLLEDENIDADNVIDIQTKTKERYKCIVPNDDELLNIETSAKNSSQKEYQTPYDILEPLISSNFCSYKYELFWTYELCHGKYLRQYHEESLRRKSILTQEYVLGYYDEEQAKFSSEEYRREATESQESGSQHERPTILFDGHYKHYVIYNMTGGTKCDLTKKDRVANVIYICSDDGRHELYSIKETSTCEYEAIVTSPLLCQHPDFKLDSGTQREIRCYSMGDAPKRPKNSIDEEDLEIKEQTNRRGTAYFQGRSIVLDTKSLFS